MTDTTTHMSPARIKAALDKLRKEVGPNAEIFVSLSAARYGSDGPIMAALYPDGMTRDSAFVLELSEWAEIVPALRAKWSEFATEHARRTIRAMALEIIKVTAEHGQCSDAALRLTFDPDTVEQYGAAACADADSIASNGPFTIARHAGANAA